MKYYIYCILILLLCCCLLECHTDKPKPDKQTQKQSKPRRTVIADKSDWAMFMRDVSRSAHSPDKTLKSPLTLRWKFKTGGPIECSPVVANGVLYVGSDDKKLYALDAQKWGERWSFKTNGAIKYAPTVWNNTVYFISMDNNVYALDAQTGELKWKFQSHALMASPVVVANRLAYIGVYPRKIYVLDAHTGEKKGEHSFRVDIGNIPYFCSEGVLMSYQTMDRVEDWRKEVPYSTSYPAIANGVVYIGSRDNKVHALSLNTRRKLWSYETNGWVDAAPAIYRGVLFVCSRDGYVYAFGNAEEEVSQQEKRNIGIVTYNEAKVYAQPDKSSHELLSLNDGVELTFLQKSNGWYQIRLPNGEAGWMDNKAFAQFREEDGMLLNGDLTPLISKSQKLSLPEGAEYPVWSPDGQNIVFFKRLNLSGRYWKAHEIWVADQNARFLRVCRGNFYNPHISWSIDSRWLAFEGHESDTAYVWIVLKNGLRLTKLAPGEAPAWSTKTRRIVFRHWGDKTDSVWRINIDKTELTELIARPIEGRANSFYLLPPVWSPDGKLIAIGFDGWHYKSGDSRIVIIDANGKVRREIFTHADRVNKISWSTDKKHLAYVLSGNPGKEAGQDVDKLLYLQNLTGTQKAKVFEHTSPVWSPDGKKLAFMEQEKCMGLKWKVWIFDFKNSTKLPVARTNINLSSIAWLPDGNRICLWTTSPYLRDGEYKPAETTGLVLWRVEAKMHTGN